MQEALIAISGIVLFLIGMIRLSSAVRKMISVRIKEWVKYAVERPLYGLVTGAVSAIIFQSSSAATALTVSLVSAGLISFYHSLAIILGADIGTTLTVQFVVWRFTEFSPILLTLGGLLWMIRRGRMSRVGELLFYFGLIFFGLELVSQSVEPLRSSPQLIDFFAQVKNPVFGIGVGMVVTAIVQASAIPISIMVILASQDLVLLENALPVVMGANIGTTVTALLAGTVANINGKRTAVSQLIFKCVGVLICLLAMPVLISVLQNLSTSVAQQIALAHLFINLIMAIVFMVGLKPFATMMNKLMPGGQDALPIWPEYLHTKDLGNPYRALDNVSRELERQIMLAGRMYDDAKGLIGAYDEGTRKNVVYVGMVVENLRSQIVRYLLAISGKHLSAHHSRRLFVYTAMAGDVQSMGKHVLDISRLAAQKAEGQIPFSECGESELADIIDLVGRNLDDALGLMQKVDTERIAAVVRREEDIDLLVRQARDNHLERFHHRLCQADAGPIFVEILIHLERVSDHCTNIAEYAAELQ